MSARCLRGRLALRSDARLGATHSFTPANTFVAAFHFTIALLPGGPSMISHPPVWFKPELVKSDKALEDAELKELLTKPLRESKKAKKKAKAEGEEAKAE